MYPGRPEVDAGLRRGERGVSSCICVALSTGSGQVEFYSSPQQLLRRLYQRGYGLVTRI